MRIWPVALILAVAFCHSAAEAGQNVVQPAVPVVPSALLSPALDGLSRTLGGLALERWKKGNVREEAATNVQKMQRDLQSTLPGLLSSADAMPGMASKALPVARNIDALYDVLLRVVDGARIAAPDEQFNQLQMALAALDKARQGFTDHIQELAAAQEKQTAELQVALKAQVVPAVVPACPAAPAVAPAKKVVKKKAAAPKDARPSVSAKPQS